MIKKSMTYIYIYGFLKIEDLEIICNLEIAICNLI